MPQAFQRFLGKVKAHSTLFPKLQSTQTSGRCGMATTLCLKVTIQGCILFSPRQPWA